MTWQNYLGAPNIRRVDSSVVLLGAVAGSTILLGLPVGRLRGLSADTRVLLNALACGVLVFLLVDILTHASEPIEDALIDAMEGAAAWWPFAVLALVAAVGFGVGLLGLVYYQRWATRRPKRETRERSGAAVISRLSPTPARRGPMQLALLIAVGIGMHNLAEGLAIGQSAAQGETSLALLLVVGFGLHNATEGFGIVAPLAGQAERPSWGQLGLLGLIAGGPTFLGTVAGQAITSDTLAVAFLALAAGSILFVVVQLVGIAVKAGNLTALAWGLFLGVLAGFATDYILVAAGA